jgi:mRNA interferase MazF
VAGVRSVGRRVAAPSRGEVWQVDLDPVRGREQGGRRPALVISSDRLNHGPSGLVVLVPFTTVDKRIPFHVPVDPPEGGLQRRSFAKPEDVRSLSPQRLGRRLGEVSSQTMTAVEASLRLLLEL